VIHQEANRITVFAAAKAMVKLLGRADAEGRRLFPMKRAQAHKISPPLLQLNIPPHDVNDISAGDKFLDEGSGDGHGVIVRMNNSDKLAKLGQLQSKNATNNQTLFKMGWWEISNLR
jgi:hypothetical protein